MLNLLLNIAGFALFIVFLGAVFFVSFYVAVVLFAIGVVGYIGLRLWAYLVEKQIVNPRPGQPIGPETIDAEFTRVDAGIEEKKD